MITTQNILDARKKGEKNMINLILEAHDKQDSITFAIWLNKLRDTYN